MALNWRDVLILDLNAKLIPDPNAGHNLLDRLRNVRVAVEGGFLHIDPRPTGHRDQGGEHDIFVVPASAVMSLVYRVPAPAEPFVGEVRSF
ncbi:hypothetical protein [Streptomyces rubiginosohelvolus]|uniref:hypothetical protein n=1 Tax=Streptomyces rubiginosohelvolus TaxID=67362 RepID=UPI0034115AF1